jgi:capsular polysaccharide biosynthesis protein
MEQLNTNKNSSSKDELDLQDLLYVLWHEKITIISVTAFISIIAVIYSLFLPNIYQSQAILTSAESSSSISQSLQNYSGLAGLAGINIPSGVDSGNSTEAIEKIGSFSFFSDNILPNIFLPDLMAIKKWNFETNNLVYDDKIYNSKSNTWVRKYSYPKKQIPSEQESFNVFKSKQLSLTQDQKTGFITLKIKHQSPYVANDWTELIVDEINTFYREKDKIESEKAISYLSQQFSMTDYSEIKEVIAKLLQEETKKLTLIEANEFYVFEYIDPPAVMEEKVEPKRAIICILSALIGGIFSVLLVLIKNYFLNKRN